MIQYDFWCVQHAQSHTKHTDKGFDSIHGLDKDLIERHIDWRDRLPTALISVFSSLLQAEKRARFLYAQGCQNVTIAKVSGASVYESTLTVNPSATYALPVLRNDQTILLSVTAASGLFGVDCDFVISEEWLALDFIPQDMIQLIYSYELGDLQH